MDLARSDGGWVFMVYISIWSRLCLDKESARACFRTLFER